MQNIETSRLLMIPFSPQLIRLALYNRAQFQRKIALTVPHDWPHADLAEFLPFLLRAFETYPTRAIWDGLVILKSEHTLIGDMGFKGGPDREGCAEIGYSIVPRYQNQGYATEMAIAFIAWAFEHKGIKKVAAECLKENTPSIRVLEKVGLHQVGTHRGMLQWTLSREAWQQTKRASYQASVFQPS